MRVFSYFLAAALAVPGWAHAAEPAWPGRPVKLVTPFPAGAGPVDLIARLLGARLTRQLGQPFIVEPRPGASGNIAAEYVAKAPPDGYTLFVGTVSQFATNGALFKSLPFDPAVHLQPLVFVGEEPFVLATNSPARGDLKSLIGKARSTPGSISFATGGAGSSQHIAGELFQRAAQIHLLHVPYKGGVPAMNDMLAGLVDVTYVTAPIAASMGAAGKLVPLAVTSQTRSDLLPRTPTMNELGFKNAEFTSWYGIASPAHVPQPVLEKIQTQFALALQDPEVKKKLVDTGLHTRNLVGSDFADFVAAERARLTEVIKAANISID